MSEEEKAKLKREAEELRIKLSALNYPKKYALSVQTKRLGHGYSRILRLEEKWERGVSVARRTPSLTCRARVPCARDCVKVYRGY